MHIHFTQASSNSKTGPMLVTTQSSDTCPTTCPFHKSGCYAEYGPLRAHWARVDDGTRDKTWQAFLQAVRRQQKGSLWRMSQAGDLPGLDGAIDAAMLQQVVVANRGYKGFTYTHKPMTKENQALIKDANDNGFTINLSANTLSDADAKADLGIAPVVVPIPADPERWPERTPAGRKVIPCLKDTKGLTCVECGLCAVASRKSVVGFPAHGSGKRKIEKAISEE